MGIKNSNKISDEWECFTLTLSKSKRESRAFRRHFVGHHFVFLLLLILVSPNLSPLVCGVPLTVHVPDTKIDEGENAITTQFQRTQQSRAPHCRYKAGTFALGDEVQTEEPCLKCHCQRTAVVCKLRMCRDMPNPPPPGCIVVQRAKKCCAELICQSQDANRKSSREQRLSTSMANASLILPPAAGEKGFCIYEGTVYAEGSAMQASSLCEYCFCIRGEMKCSSPQCVIPLNGCKPKFRSYACCPTNYDCNESNATAILKTIPTSTVIPIFLKGCQVQGRFINDGEPILPIQLDQELNRTNLCQTCFCMGGVVSCRPLECDRPIQGCIPITSDGHCCPDRYDCGTASTTPIPLPPPIQQNLITKPQENTKEEITLPKILDNGNRMAGNLNNKNKSEIGSREERRNRDKDDFAIALKTSYEHEDDNGKEESLSFEHGELDAGSSLSFEGTSEQSNSRLEIETIMEPASETELPDTSSVEDNDVSIIVTESENELEDSTTTPLPGFSTLLTTTKTRTTSTEAPSTTTTEIIIPAKEEEPNSTTSSVAIKRSEISSGILATLASESDFEPTISAFPIEELTPTSTAEKLISNLNISGIDSNSTRTEEMTITGAKSLANSTTTTDQEYSDIEMETTAATTTSSNSNLNMTTTLSNLRFISFGVEDALVGDPNAIGDINNKYDSPVAPIKIVYDQNALRTSLIQPTPPKGYIHVPLKASEPLDLDGEVKNPIITVPAPDSFKDELIAKNHVVDISVSASLYNNGYFSNGVAAPTNLSGFPGHVFEDPLDGTTDNHTDPHPMAVGSNDKRNNEPPAIFTSATSDAIESRTDDKIENREADPAVNFNSPLRTYSKFGIQDAPFYRFGFEPANPERRGPTKPKNTPVAPDDDHRFYDPVSPMVESHGAFNPYTDYELEDTYDESFEKGIQQQQKLLNNYRFENYGIIEAREKSTTLAPPKPSTTLSPTTTAKGPSRSSSSNSNTKKKSPSTLHGGFKPVVAFPFMIPKNKPIDSLFNIGVKLSGCNIYGKMYVVGKVILELSSPCLQCECSEMGVQCTELPC